MVVSIARCEADESVFSTEGLQALQEIKDTIEKGRWLAIALSVIPFFDLFLDPAKPHVKIGGAAAYDWEGFAKTMSAIPTTEKRKIRDIVDARRLYSIGDEREFWRCASEALR